MKVRLGFFILFLLTSFFVGPGSVVASDYTPPPRVTFTFDDGTRHLYTLAAPLFSAKNLKAVIYGETYYLTSGEDWVMTWDELKDLRDRLGWEIGSHTVTHPNLTTLSAAALEKELADSKKTFLDHGIVATAFSSPYGEYNNKVLKAIAKHYSSHRAAWGGPNIWPDNYNDYELWTMEVKHTTPPEEVMGWIDEAIANNQWLVLLLHDVVVGTPVEYEYNQADLEKIVNYTASRPINVVTMQEGLNPASGQNLVPNGSFETLSGNFASDWTRSASTGITIDTSKKGNFPNPKNSLKIVGAAKQREAVTGFISVPDNIQYLAKMYHDATAFTSGGWSIWVDEYDASNTLLGGQWLGGGYEAFLGVKYYPYAKSTGSVSKIKIKIYTEPGSKLTLFTDSVEIRSLAFTPAPNPTSTPTPTVTVPTPTPIPTSTPLPTSTPMPSTNLLSNGDFSVLDQTGFAQGWTKSSSSVAIADSKLKIIAGSSQNLAISPRVQLPDSQSSYKLSFNLDLSGYQSGGVAFYIDEFDASGNWVGGKWLGGKYAAYSGPVAFVYHPTTSTAASVDIHFFTESGSNLTMFVDDAKLNL